MLVLGGNVKIVYPKTLFAVRLLLRYFFIPIFLIR